MCLSAIHGILLSIEWPTELDCGER
jgi:hypothetical protein